MWLMIRDSDNAVMGTNYGTLKPLAPGGHTVKEWYGVEPPIHNPDRVDEEGEPDPTYSYDPTLEDPGYPAFLEARLSFDDLADKATAEIGWLDDTIPEIDSMTVAEVRDVVKRLAKQNRETIKAWRYVIKRFT